jgi:broad specificity phosphatase PhoE
VVGARTRTLYLVRHGQYNQADGSTDSLQGLTDLGRQQALQTGRRLRELIGSAPVTARIIVRS